MSSNISVTVKTPIGDKNFGFFASEATGRIFVHAKDLTRWGFSYTDMTLGQSAVVDFEENEQGLRTTRIRQIGDKVGSNQPVSSKAKPVSVKDKKKKSKPRLAYELGQVLTGNVKCLKEGFGFIEVKGYKDNIFFPMKLVPKNEAPFVEVGVQVEFIVCANERGVIAEITHLPLDWDKATRREVDRHGDQVVIIAKIRNFERYEVRAQGKGGELISLPASLREARELIGKKIVPLEGKNHGRKTNDPALSQKMRANAG